MGVDGETIVVHFNGDGLVFERGVLEGGFGAVLCDSLFTVVPVEKDDGREDQQSETALLHGRYDAKLCQCDEKPADVAFGGVFELVAVGGIEEAFDVLGIPSVGDAYGLRHALHTLR